MKKSNEHFFRHSRIFQIQQFWNSFPLVLWYTDFTVRITLQLGEFKWTQEKLYR